MSNFFTKLTSVVGVATLVAVSTSASLVSAASEFLPYAEVLADNSVISAQTSEAGYRLGNNITRAEIAKVVANLGGIEATACSGDVFSDVGAGLGDLCGYVEALADAGVVSTASATFRPSANVTRAEMVKMILGALGETGSDVDAGYMDLTGLGDLASYINRANEIGCVSDSSYFRPNASSSRGEAFKVAVVCAGLDVDTTEPTDGTGTTSTGTTSTGTTAVTGNLTVALDGQAMAQYVPKNASSVKVGAVKLTAGTTDVTVQSLVVSRSGLGNANDIQTSNGIRAAQNGVVISSSADYYNATSQKATVYFSPALVVKAGASQTVDILVNLTGAENSQHQITLDSVNASNTTVSGSPVTLGLLNTTSYVTATTTATLTNAGGNVTAGKTQQLFAKVDVSAGGRETKVTGFTLTRAAGTNTGYTYGSDLNKRFQNVKLYKNGVAVGTITMTNEKLSVSGLSDVLAAGNTQTYELKGDVLIDATSNALGLKFDATTDVNAVETTTGYSTQVSATSTVVDVVFGSVEFTFAKTSTGNLTVAPGENNIKLFAGKLSSSTPVSVRTITIDSVVTGTGIASYVNDQLSVKLNGSEIATITTLPTGSNSQPKTVSFVVDSANPAWITIEGSTKNQASIAPSSVQFTVSLTEVRDSTNNTIAATNLGAGKSLTGDKTTINTSAVEIKTATVAAPSTSRVYSSAEQEIGRFAITSRNEASRVQSLTFTATTSTGTIQTIANSTSSAKLVDVATNAEVSATVTISGNTLTFSSMNDSIGKDITKNYKVVLGVTSVDTYYGMTLQLALTASNIVRDSNSSSVTPTGSATFKSYTVGTVAPTVLVTAVNENTFKVRVTNPDTNTGIVLTGATFDFKTALPGNTSYAASAYLRDLGSTNTFGGVGVSTQSGSVAGLDKTIAVTGLTTSMTADKNGGYIEFEVYIDSANLLPTGGQLQVSLKKLFYSVGGSADTESYVGTTGASATFTK